MTSDWLKYNDDQSHVFEQSSNIDLKRNKEEEDRIYNEVILVDNPFISKNASLEILQHFIIFIKKTKRLS